MNEQTMVNELIEYFASPSGYSDKLILELTRTCANIPEEDRYRVCEMIREDNAPNFKVGVKAIAEACRKLSVPFHKSSELYVPAVNWTCDACGMTFKYAQVVSYQERHDKDISDYCPRCGFQPCDTIQARAESKLQRGKFRDWYQARKDRFMDDYYKRKCWLFDKKEDDEFMARMRREEMEAMKKAAQDELSLLTKNTKVVV